MKAVIYSRFSTERQNESSITDQVRVCSEYAKQNDITVTETFADEGISGAALGNRPGARALMEAAFALRFEVVIVTDLSRLSRSTGDLNKMIDRLVARSIRVIGVQDGYDSARRGHKLQAGLAGIMGEAFRDMIKERTHGALEGRARAHRSAGGRCFGFGSEPVNPDDPASQRRYVIDEEQATVIRQIFTRYVDGASCRTIAMELNECGIASPGSSWKRRVRRCRGWVASGIHAMVRNERYVGKIIWNASEWIKDPDTGKRRRRKRPRSEWIVHQDEGLRIISDALFEKAQQRTRETSNDHVKLKSGGRPKYLLSGLLRCGECGAHYVLGGAASYVCSGYLGGDCSNSIRVRRDRVEQVILDPIREELLAPDRVERMAREMQRLSAARFSERAKNAAAVPAEIEAISDRIKRLQERLSLGDPDLEPDEIQSVIDRVERKREDLLNEQPVAKESARIISMLPRAAEAFRRQITLGLDKDSRAAGKARVILRKLLGTINLRPGPDKSLWAEYELCPSALLKSAGIAGTEGTTGSGGRI